MQRAETIKLERLGLRAAKSPTVKSQALVTRRDPALAYAFASSQHRGRGFQTNQSGQGGVDE